ncbi:response regulator [Heyndrickxia coagulans]|uniref:response regulator n=1 Tax=Heyndrickxia coagulans TaxID=1398 RepID=UPI001F491D85|nr:hypothetical protein [Heyndrickxia coagulans]
MKILLAEDDRRFGKLLHHMLEKEKHQVAGNRTVNALMTKRCSGLMTCWCWTG